MKKGITILVAVVFVMSLFAMMPMAVGSGVPDEIRGRPYYYAADKRMSAITSAAQFGNIITVLDGPPTVWDGWGVLYDITIQNRIPYKEYDYWGGGETYQISDCGNYGYDFEGSDQYCCREYAGHIEWFLENMGFDTEIWVTTGHAYNKILLSDGQWYILNAMNIRNQDGVLAPPGALGGVRYEDVYSANTMTGGVAFWDYNQNPWGENYIDNAIAMMPPYTPPDPYPTFSYGITRGGMWYLDYYGNQETDESFKYGIPGDIPVKLNGGYGMFRDGMWYLDYNDDQITDERFKFGIAGDIPVYYGNIKGVFRDGMWYLDYDGDHDSDWWGTWGLPGDQALIADMDGDGSPEMVLFRDGMWFADCDGNAESDLSFKFGIAGDKPIVFSNGDYGVLRGGWWYIDTNGDQITDERFKYGIPGDMPIQW